MIINKIILLMCSLFLFVQVYGQIEVNESATNLRLANEADIFWQVANGSYIPTLTLHSDNHVYFDYHRKLQGNHRPTIDDISQTFLLHENGDLEISGQLKGAETVSFMDFIASDDDYGDRKMIDYRYASSNNVIGHDDLFLTAGANIPEGATITKAKVYFLDNNNDESLKVSLVRENLLTGAIIQDQLLLLSGITYANSNQSDTEINLNLTIGTNEMVYIKCTAEDSDDIAIRAVILEYE